MCIVEYSSQGTDELGTFFSLRNFQKFWCSIVNELSSNKSHAGIVMRSAIDFFWEHESDLHKLKYHTGWWRREKNHETVKLVEKVEELPGGTEFEKCKGNCEFVPSSVTAVVPSQSSNLTTVALFAIFIFAGILVASFIGFFMYRRFRANKLLSRNEVNQFFKGSPSSFVRSSQSHVETQEMVDDLPYDENLEVAKSEIAVYKDNILGSGSFGVVVKGRIGRDEVAVKTTFPGVEKVFLEALMLELKVLAYLGQHENIVKLRGAHTPELTSGKLFLFLELCPMGNLLNFLRSHREDLSQSIDSPDELSNKNGQILLTGKCLLQWSVQVASAMVYLSGKKVIHGDIAARNVLVFSWDQVKLTDFGLSRRLYEYLNYVKKKQDPMPWRHMSVEALRNFSFSLQSDVWAFGVTLWETFSLGEVPFPGRSWSMYFLHLLLNGLRPLRPELADPLIYEVMSSCWTIDVQSRPHVEEVHSKLSFAMDIIHTHPGYLRP